MFDTKATIDEQGVLAFPVPPMAPTVPTRAAFPLPIWPATVREDRSVALQLARLASPAAMFLLGALVGSLLAMGAFHVADGVVGGATHDATHASR